jgi:hypothetical protein
MSKSLQILNTVFKVLICPFFFFFTILSIDAVIILATKAHKINYGETIEGSVILILIIGPMAFLITTFVSLIILRVMNKFVLLQNEKFLMIWGIGMAVFTYVLLALVPSIIKIFHLIF